MKVIKEPNYEVKRGKGETRRILSSKFQKTTKKKRVVWEEWSERGWSMPSSWFLYI